MKYTAYWVTLCDVVLAEDLEQAIKFLCDLNDLSREDLLVDGDLGFPREITSDELNYTLYDENTEQRWVVKDFIEYFYSIKVNIELFQKIQKKYTCGILEYFML